MDRRFLNLAAAGLAAATVAGEAAAASREAECRRFYQENNARCIESEIAKQGGNPTDFSFYQRCADACDRAEAEDAIDWVLERDRGARAAYEALLGRGRSPLDAVIGAQGHNPRAQAAIRRCADWARDHIAGREGGQGRRAGRPAAKPPPLAVGGRGVICFSLGSTAAPSRMACRTAAASSSSTTGDVTPMSSASAVSTATAS